ncbi:MAG: hypothetical protein KF774_11170 [Planctomyces sp.]|nr:hypothetical protein [Planctomyces sp.]
MDSMDDVPFEHRERYLEILTLTDGFCDRHLNEEYKDVCRRLAGYVCQNELPVLRGKVAGWACGIAYAVGSVNFLTDSSQSPHMAAEEIAKGFGVSPATMYSRYRDISNVLELIPKDPEFTIASQLSRNLLVWLAVVDGIPVDLRTCPREVQALAFERGLIPYIPADRNSLADDRDA